MGDPFKKLYDDISGRKAKPDDCHPYRSGNGRIDRAVDLIRNEDFPKSGSLLDVGGAIGNLGYALKDMFSPRWTIDIADVCREPAEKKGNSFILSNVDEYGFSPPDGGIIDEEIDLVVALDFIEHILNPQKFASECYRVLKSGGRVLINTPNIQFWRHLHSLVVDGRFPHTSGDREVYHGGHVAFFNLQDLVDIFFEAGFVDMRMHTRGLDADAPPPIWNSLFKPKSNEDIIAPSLQLAFADLIFSCKKP